MINSYIMLIINYSVTDRMCSIITWLILDW